MPGNSYRLALHGLAVEILCEVDALRPALEDYLGEFAVPGWPQGFTPVVGTIRTFDERQTLKGLSPAAKRTGDGDSPEIFHDAERYWLIDERWGMSEINLLKGHWKSWIIPNASADLIRCVHAFVLWPLAQLLRMRSLHLLPACAVGRGGRAFLILCPYSIEPELAALIRAGWRIIGQSWTAVREENGKIELLHMPGHVERSPAPRLCSVGAHSLWVDLMQEHDGAEQRYGWCEGVLVVESGRRPEVSMNIVDPSATASLLKAAWPIAELHPQRTPGQFASRLAHKCACYQVAVSRDASEFVEAMARIGIRAYAA